MTGNEVVRVDAQHPRGYIEQARVKAVQAGCDGALADLRKARDLHAVASMNDTSPRFPVFVLLRDEAGRVLGAAP